MPSFRHTLYLLVIIACIDAAWVLGNYRAGGSRQAMDACLFWRQSDRRIDGAGFKQMMWPW